MVCLEGSYLVSKVRTVVGVGISELPGLSFVVPPLGSALLSLFEIRNRIALMADRHQVLRQLEVGIGHENPKTLIASKELMIDQTQ